jgi:3',5'-cyclic AMP phosphodiesterase CpdA
MTFLGNINENWSKQFFTPARKLMRNTVLWPTIGNHELNASLYFDYFSTPNSDEHYYSFDYGNSRFIVLAVEGYAVGHEYGPKTRTPMDPGSPQYEWLKKTLAESQDKSWRFVFCHQSPFASGLEGGYTPAQKILVPLFEQYKVNVVFSGHDHIYEASVKDNISYIVTGGGGGAVSPLQPDLRSNPFSRYLKGVWHHCNVNISPDRVLVKAIDLKGHAFHFVTIEQPSSPQVTVREGN